MRKHLIVLACAWIMWDNQESLFWRDDGTLDKWQKWVHIAGFESKGACEKHFKSHIVKESAFAESLGMEFRLGRDGNRYTELSKETEKGGKYIAMHRLDCLPSDFDPRPKTKD